VGGAQASNSGTEPDGPTRPNAATRPRNLGLRVVAEGIEDRATWDRLHEMGCDVAQGDFLSRPVPGDVLTPWLAERARPVAPAPTRPGWHPPVSGYIPGGTAARHHP
jgi:hypothetical protein